MGRLRVGRNGAFFGKLIAKAEDENKETGEGGGGSGQRWKEARDNRAAMSVEV